MERKLICCGSFKTTYEEFFFDSEFDYEFYFEEGENENFILLFKSESLCYCKWTLPNSHDFKFCCKMLKDLDYYERTQLLDKFNCTCPSMGKILVVHDNDTFDETAYEFYFSRGKFCNYIYLIFDGMHSVSRYSIPLCFDCTWACNLLRYASLQDRLEALRNYDYEWYLVKNYDDFLWAFQENYEDFQSAFRFI